MTSRIWSEQLKLSGAHGVSAKEAIAINSSLLVLGKVVSALLEERSHVPYRESALTLLLRASLGGSSRTTAIVTAPLCDAHAEQTFHSLKFGERCQLVTNTAALHVASLSDALGAIDEALVRCDASIGGLQARGLGGSDGARKLRERSAELSQKRAALSSVDQ
ncbi:P-loop containing nucleoside triphosphate hydrolase protein [Pavlovales sp. CCMP2436]|nr:P-loop containing nucleoside triphosphate hydrolase protein [Pavlovales sp. CCMP2436]